MPLCKECNTKEATKACVCGTSYYCGTECQKKDWKKHKTNCPPFCVKNIDGKGNGLFAIRKINFGDKILSDKSVLTIHNHSSENFEDWCDYVLEKVMALDEDKFKEFESLSDNPSFQKSAELMYLKLKNGYTEDKLKFLRILRTNGINTDEQGSTTCVFPLFSLLNHSCAPNAMRNFDNNLNGHLTVTAAREIAKGEEITIKYFNQEIAVLGRDKRRQKLLNWGFLCSCEICSLEGAELETNENLRKYLEAAKIDLKVCPTDPTNISSLQTQRNLELNIINLLRQLNTQLVAELPDHLMACHHVIKLLIHHRQNVPDIPDQFRNEALELSKKLGSAFVSEFEFWDNLTTNTLNSFKARRKSKKKT